MDRASYLKMLSAESAADTTTQMQRIADGMVGKRLTYRELIEG